LLIRELKNAGIVFSPLFLIHDAIILDIHPEHLKAAKKIIKSGIKIEKMGIEFPLSITTQ